MFRILLFLLITISIIPLKAQSDLSRAEAAFLERNFIEAISIAEQCLAKDSIDTQCIQLIANASNKQGDQAMAKKYFHKLEKLDSNNINTYIQLASIYDQQLQIPRAIKYYSILNKLLPENSFFFRKNAKLYRTVNDNKEAFRLYAKANKLNPRDVMTLKSLAELCVANNQMEMADSLIQIGLGIDKENISMYYILARSKYKQKQFDSVTLILEGLQGQVDLNSYYNKLLGYSYLQIDSIDLAIQKLQIALVDEDTSEKLYYYLASAYEKNGEMQGAFEQYENAAKFAKSPDLDLYHRNAARLANNTKKYKQAIAHYKDAYKFGNDPLVLYYLATICDTYYKDKSIAINYYKKYIQSSHSNSKYQKYAKTRSRYLKEIDHQSK